jgi:hypothetical protein
VTKRKFDPRGLRPAFEDFQPPSNSLFTDTAVSRGRLWITTSLWPSKATDEEINRVGALYPVENVEVSGFNTARRSVGATSFELHFETPGSDASLSPHAFPKVISGNFVRIDLSFENEGTHEEIEYKLRSVLSPLKLTLGESAAIHETHRSTANIALGFVKIHNKPFMNWSYLKKGRDGISLFEYESILTDWPIKLTDDLAFLVHNALLVDQIENRFFFLWTAVELIAGRGDERKRYCKETLGSDIINQELFRLFKLRGDLLKEFSRNIDFIDVSSLLSFIQLSNLTQTEVRSIVVSRYENWVLQHGRLSR